MYIDAQGKRINPHAIISVGGLSYPGNILSFPEAVAAAGIQEISDPQPPAKVVANPDHYYRTEQDTYPYVVWSLKSPEQISDLELKKTKNLREASVSKITVTTAAGNTFDGDEKSQERMARSLVALEEGETLPWVLANNTVVTVGKPELKEALRLAGAKLAEEWIKPYVSPQEPK